MGYTRDVSLQPYHDDFIQADLGHQFGTYMKSYSNAHGLVEVHVFKADEGDFVAYITKAASVPLAMAQDLATQALRLIGAIEGTRPRVVIDAGSIPTSGSL